MNFIKVIFGIICGVLSTSLPLSIIVYLLSRNYTSGSGNFISFPNPENLMMIVGAIFGAVIGGISGGIIAGFQLKPLKAVCFGFLFNLFISLVLIFYISESEKEFLSILCALIVIGVINGAVVSLISVNRSADYT